MNYLYILLTAAGAVFLAFTVTVQIRLNRHTDAQAKFLVAAKNYNFSPLKSMAKRTFKYFLISAALMFIVLGGTAVVYGIVASETPDLILSLAVFALGLAACAVNGLIILVCAMAYVRHKTDYTAVM